MGRFHKDIVNIVRRLVLCKAIKKCNEEYRKQFKYDGSEDHYELRYKNGLHCICYRNIRKNEYRRYIVYFLTDKLINYRVPENY